MSDKLTGKQKKFADEYIICLNATESCRRAGYAGDNNVLAVQGNRLLRNSKILLYIDERLKAFAMPANEILAHLTDIARGDISDAMNNIGGVDPLEAVRRGKSHLIKRFKTKTTIIAGKGDDDGMEIHETEIEMYDRLTALDRLAKYHDLINRVKVDTWETELLQLLRDGKITPEMVLAELGHDLATQLFVTAGLPIVTGGES
jgi:phage terminase small subunit